MNDSAAKLAYMRAHIRLHAHVPVDNWSPAQIMECFAILPPPMVPFETWAANALELDEPADAQPAEADEVQANSNAVAILAGAAKPEIIQIASGDECQPSASQ